MSGLTAVGCTREIGAPGESEPAARGPDRRERREGAPIPLVPKAPTTRPARGEEAG